MVAVRDASDLGHILREHRKARSMTQAELADLVGVSRQWVISAEAGAPTAQLGLILYALRTVGLTLDLRPDDTRASSLLDQVFDDD